MKFRKPPKFQVTGAAVPMPLIAWILNSLFYGDRVYNDWRIWAFSMPLIMLMGFTSWYMHFQYSESIRQRFPELSQTGKRNRYLLFIYPFVMVPSILIIFFTYDIFSIFGYSINWDDLKMALVVGLIVDVIFEPLWEVFYIAQKYKESMQERDLLEQMSISQEFENIKSLVNPHFLFNCFNTLSSLITEDKKEAEKFLNELSKVYRYLLRTNEEGVSTLENELKFIESYYRLLKTRHGDALNLNLSVDRNYNNYLLPSLSLQLLVENAVKHNVVSKTQPLSIEIYTTGKEQLIVDNNLQPKLKKEASTGIGLNNIRKKYKLLKKNGFEVEKSEASFRVVLPLVWNNNTSAAKRQSETNKNLRP